MKIHQIVAIVLIVLGVLALAWGGFSYTKETHEASIGSLSLSVDERRHVNVPVWVGRSGCHRYRWPAVCLRAWWSQVFLSLTTPALKTGVEGAFQSLCLQGLNQSEPQSVAAASFSSSEYVEEWENEGGSLACVSAG